MNTADIIKFPNSVEGITPQALIARMLQEANDAVHILELISIETPELLERYPGFKDALREIGRHESAIRLNLLRARFER